MKPIRTKLLDLPDISDLDWHDLISLRTEYSKEIDPDDPVKPFEAQKVALSSAREWQNLIQYSLIYDEADQCVGFFLTETPKPEHPDYETNKNALWVDIFLRPPYRRQGIARQLLPHFVEKAREYGARVVQAGSELEVGYTVMAALGAEPSLTERVSRMTMADVDWDMMRRWVDDGKSRNPDVEVIRFDHLPLEEDIKAYCELVSELDSEIPLEDIEEEKYTLTVDELHRKTKRLVERGDTYIVFYARDTDGSLMGMTGMFHANGVDTLGYVGLTGVRPKYQGRGLGKYLKALMTYDLRDNFPRVKYVSTENAESNAPMLSINERMGFKPHKSWIAYKITVEDLERVLETASLDASG